MSRGLTVIDGPVEGADLAFLAGDAGRVPALRTRGELGLLVGRVRQRVGGDRGGDSLSDRVRGAFDLGEREPLRVGDGMRVRPAEDRQNLASDAAEFVVGEFGECHRGIGGNGEGFPGRRSTAKMKICAAQYPRPVPSANRVLHPTEEECRQLTCYRRSTMVWSVG